jgi:hypothetical protein
MHRTGPDGLREKLDQTAASHGEASVKLCEACL